ncbi:putative lipoyltransferase 2, mitochondrial [Fopius arisanus]|uniref:Octanoyl-[acyl-carrier-protein]:protein N-octanoyltransferase LIPT2, mitochondrial n=1 Tax=Fopius arisanus TaxID=64838 RepID=A0A9R1TMP8_9HYME|nr:PREDICTED: putative lipoyltransferase 2, mitochondrial [Fopius arisanus]
MKKKLVKILWAGRMCYQSGLHLQHQLSKHHHDPDLPSDYPRNSLILIEHNPVYTVGIRHKDYTEEDITNLKSTGAEFHKTNRGGLITFHGPGQLVVYPIINLRDFQPSVRWYVCQIEKMIIRLCAEFGIKGETSPDTGVWVRDKKICAIGIHGSRYVTTHGLGLNCNTDLKWFEHIVPCGIEGKGVTSLSRELDTDVGIDDVIPVMKNAFREEFQCEIVDFDRGDASGYLRKAVQAAEKI